MKIEIIVNGKRISGELMCDASLSDVVVISKKMIDGATITGERFDELFYHELKSSRTHEDAYNRVEEEHFGTFGHNKYSGFDSFRISRNNRLKK